MGSIPTLAIPAQVAMETIDPTRLAKLRRYAETARARHHAPYSKFLVLAAVEAEGGSVYAGSNVEIANYSLTVHAEQMAILTAINAGCGPERPWLRALYVVGGAPCGSCRQFAHEFASADAMWIIDRIDQDTLRGQSLVDAAQGKEPETATFAELFPKPFGPDDLLGAGDVNRKGD